MSNRKSRVIKLETLGNPKRYANVAYFKNNNTKELFKDGECTHIMNKKELSRAIAYLPKKR
jgi:hypothetical protein